MMGTCDGCGKSKDVAYCGICDAYLCVDCRGNPVIRAYAASRRVRTRLGKFLSR